MNDQIHEFRQRLISTAGRLALVALGVVVSQFVLYGPSLVGQKVLLPLDLLAQPGVYLPISPGEKPPIPHNKIRSDLIYIGEPGRQFASDELHAGRWPVWDPYQFAGTPSIGAKFSVFWWLRSEVRSPVVLAWVEMLVALLAAFGMYAFCRNVLRTSYWPAVVVAWCYPLTGFFIFWQGYGLSYGAAWLPWLLLAVDKTVRQASPWSAPSLALLTALVVADGRPDIAGEVLLASGLYALWCFFDQYRRPWFRWIALRSLVLTTAAWGLGFLLVAGHLFPTIEYMRSGARMMRRGQGAEERPPIGLAALPQAILPDVYGSEQIGNIPMFELRGGVYAVPFPEKQSNQLEGAAATYAGLLATLLLAPLGWCSQRHRFFNVFWLGLAILGLGWVLNIPGLVNVMRMPGLNMLSHNRFVFVTSFAILAMAAEGLDVLAQGEVQRRRWFWAPTALVGMLFAWCLYRSIFLPEPYATDLERLVANGHPYLWINNLASVHWVQTTYRQNYTIAGLLCAIALGGWLLLDFQVRLRRWVVPLVGLLLTADLLLFGYGRSEQCDGKLYYPRIPILQDLAKEADEHSARVMGHGLFPPALTGTHQLRDARGYDAVDPARIVDLLLQVRDFDLERKVGVQLFPYALTQNMLVRMGSRASGAFALPPILDMLAVRYLIFRGKPGPGVHPAFAGDDYWVMENRSALPRVYVPQQVEVLADDRERLKRMAAADFNPRQVAYVEAPLEHNLTETCRGEARIVDEIPTRVTISLDMQTPGLVVLADRWDPGWHAYLDGRRVPILRTNHALRGVEAPAGKATLEFRYESASLAWGLCTSALAVMATLAWLGVGLWIGPVQMPPEPAPALRRGKDSESAASKKPGPERLTRQRPHRRR